jgi:exopolysaccharide biosynthesis polyprenyl glycosylphosphotransferase
MSIDDGTRTNGAGGNEYLDMLPTTRAEGFVAARGMVEFWRKNSLKLLLVAGDTSGLLLGSFIGHWYSGYFTSSRVWQLAVTTVVAVVAGVWCIRSQGLLLARNSAVRVVELTKLARASVLLAVVFLLADRVLKLGLRIEQAIWASATIFVALVVWRSVYRTWLGNARARGRYLRPTIVVGSNSEVARLVDLLTTHRELGMDVLGVVGDVSATEHPDLRDMWIGTLDRAEEFVVLSGASGVIVSPIGIDVVRFNALIRNLQRDGVHVFVTTGLTGIESRRLRSMALAHEPMLYVEPPKFNRAQTVVKRVFDLVVASTLLVVATPIMLLVAVGVKVGDRGPVFFRQIRVGKGGQHFRLWKFRTMAVDAEQRMAALAATNERSGPLFKMAADPRVTRFGRWLRDSSLDELPQLFNVLRGEMSLVGPRPALPSEVEQFSADVRMRELVPPGITGLWQVEARDNPSFEAYRRLDLFYVENWSTTLDLLIVLATIEHIASRIIGMFTRRAKPVAVKAPPILPLWGPAAGQ